MKQRAYVGQNEAEPLLQWLEVCAKPQASRRIEALIELFQRYEKLSCDIQKEQQKPKWTAAESLSKEYLALGTLLAEVATHTARYKPEGLVTSSLISVNYAIWERFEAHPKRDRVLALSFKTQPKSHTGRALNKYLAQFIAKSKEEAMVGRLLGLARLGSVRKLRRCSHCAKWFFSRMKQNQFCSVGCQQAKHRTKPNFKEGRAQYMRAYRRKEAAREKRQAQMFKEKGGHK